MLFNSALYGVFLLAVYAAFWALRTHRIPRAVMLTLASYFFYFYGTYDTSKEQDVPLGPLGWSVLCLGVIFVGSTIDFAVGKKLGATEDPRMRKALLLVSVVYYLGVLSIFKYFNFAVDSVSAALAMVHVKVPAVHLKIVLPFGISFFTFETMSYTIDVYRRELKPAQKYLDYLLFVCFFPHLVAGPIVRPASMLPQLAETPAVGPEMDAKKAHGLSLIATGLLKKMVIGDTLAVNLVGRVFDNPERYSSIEVLFAIYGYAIQIYADFSGYTDVARGSAMLFGYDLPENFAAPYTSDTIQDFWRRWHMSLSSWLRDYLYIPLGGNRGGTLATYRNLLLTMVLGGLWHGASWNFVLWGALHGGGLGVERATAEKKLARVLAFPAVALIALYALVLLHVMSPRTYVFVLATTLGTIAVGVALAYLRKAEGAGRWFAKPVAVVLCFHFVCFCWIFFRAPTFDHGLLMLLRLGKGTLTSTNLSPLVLRVLLLGAVLHFVPKKIEDEARALFTRAPAPLQGVILAACGYLLHFAASTKAEPFVYGQF